MPIPTSIARSLLAASLLLGHVLLLSQASRAQEDPTAAATEPDVITLAAEDAELALSFPSGDETQLPTSPVIETPARLIGVTWQNAPPAAISLRTRDVAGQWSAWRPLEPLDTGADAAESTNQRATEPVWVGSETSAVQFRAAVARTDLSAILLGAPVETTAATLSPASTTTTDNGVVVNLRDTWDDGCRNPEAEVRFSDVKVAVVHHTTGSNTYSLSDVPSLINSICHYHVDALGWDDIGYNFVVDRFGGVWEGRTGGIDRPVSGAHAAGFNSASVGVALLGDHSSSAPTAAALARVGNLVGWKLWLDGVPATGTTLVISQGSAKWPAGSVVALNRISGHRDVQSTTCPGDQAYGNLGNVRTTASAAISSLPPRPVASDEVMYYFDSGPYWYYDLAANGALNGVIESGAYAAGWDQITALDADGDGQDELMFYFDTGFYQTYNVNANGQLAGLIRSGYYAAGWDHIVAVDLDGTGKDELLFYFDSGAYWYYEVAANGALDGVITSGAYAAGWDQITAVDFDGDGQDELLFYFEDGRYQIYDIGVDGTLGALLTSGSYAAGWDRIAAVDVDGDGQHELMFYFDTGFYQTYNVNANGQLAGLIRSGYYAAGWDHIVAVDLDG